jgi:hypothetical protein
VNEKKICVCGHSKSMHSPQSENYNAPAPCQEQGCKCEDFRLMDERE